MAAYGFKQSQKAELLEAAQAAADAKLQGYGQYQSGYQADLNKAYNDILNRKKFSYDLGSDALYQQYKDQYVRGGKLAMQDTVGQAAALTGGYGNSWATTAGSQAYQQYLTGLNDKVPQLYQMALQAYEAEGDRLRGNYDLARGADADAYGRWQDGYERLSAAAKDAYNRYNDQRGFDYNDYTNMIGWQRADEQEAQRAREAAAQLALQQRELDANINYRNQQIAMQQRELEAKLASAAQAAAAKAENGKSTGSGAGGKNKNAGNDELSDGEIALGQMTGGTNGKKGVYVSSQTVQGTKKETTRNTGAVPYLANPVENAKWLALAQERERLLGKTKK